MNVAVKVTFDKLSILNDLNTTVVDQGLDIFY